MAAFAFTPLTINGNTIIGGSIASSYFLVPNSPGQTQNYAVVAASVVNLGEEDVRGQPQSAIWRLRANLASFNETDIQALRTLFNEQAGLVYLRVTDGDGAIWRTQVRVTGIEMLNAAQYDVVLYVPNPTWEQDTQQTNNQTNMSGGGPTFTLTNAGTRKARPAFTITPNTVKSDVIDDWKYSLRGLVVNPSSKRFSGPIYLFDQKGVQGRIDTRTLIKDTTVSNQINQVGGIGTTDTTITINTPVGGGLPARGMAWIDSEQISYTANSGTQLTGVTRGIGLSGVATHANGAVISKSEALNNGYDVSVWLNGSRLAPEDVWPVNWNSATSDVVINADLPASPSASGVALGPFAIAAGDNHLPVNNGGFDNLPNSGFCLVKYPSGIGWEVVYYTGKSNAQLTGVTRGLWGTTALACSSVLAVFYYANPVQFVVAVGKSTEPLRPTGPRRPAIQLPGSSNQTWKWGDGSDDSNTVFFDPLNPDRTAAWSPGYDTDGNTGTPLVALTNQSTALQFTDENVGQGALPYNQATIELAQGTAASGNFVADWTPAAEVLNLELWGRDSSGTDQLLDQLQQAAQALGRTFALTTSLSALKLKGRYNIITGVRGADANIAVTFSNATNPGVVIPFFAGEAAISFTLAQNVNIASLMIRANVSAALNTTNDLVYLFTKDANGAPSSAVTDIISIPGVVLTITGTTPAFYTIPLNGQIVAAGKYWLVGYRARVTGNDPNIQILGSLFTSQICEAVVPGATTSTPFKAPWMYALSQYDSLGNALIQTEMPVRTSAGARSGVAANFDKVVVPLLNFPLVHRVSGFTNTLYHENALITDNTTGDSIAVDQWMKTAATLAIDCNARTVTLTEDAIAYSVPGAIAPSNLSDWLALAAGGNSITFAEPDMVSTSLASTWRGRKV